MGCPVPTLQEHSKHNCHLIAFDAGWLLFLVFLFFFLLYTLSGEHGLLYVHVL